MRSVRCGLAVLTLASLLTGCSSLTGPQCCSTTGWSFTVGRPSTIATVSPTVLNPQNGPIGIQPLGAHAGTAGTVISNPPAMPEASSFQPLPHFRGPNIAVYQPDPCSIQALCFKMDKVLDLLGAKREE